MKSLIVLILLCELVGGCNVYTQPQNDPTFAGDSKLQFEASIHAAQVSRDTCRTNVNRLFEERGSYTAESLRLHNEIRRDALAECDRAYDDAIAIAKLHYAIARDNK